MSSCRQASQLISDAMNRRLTLRERVSLRIHLMVCRACREFKRQAAIVREAMRVAADGAALGVTQGAAQEATQDAARGAPEPAATSAGLSPEARERIRKAVRQVDGP